MPHRRPSLFVRFTAAILSIVIFFAAAEAVVRLLDVNTAFQNRFFVLNRALDYPDVFIKDRHLFWRLRPNQQITSRFFEGKTYRINSRGLRDPEPPVDTNDLLVLALGNSCTFGWGVALEETYVYRLGLALGDRVTVVNGAVPGYTSLQGRRFLESQLLDLSPDIVLICYAWNDHWAAANQIADKDQQFPPQMVISIQNLLSRSHSYCLFKKLLLSLVEQNPDSLFDRTAPVYRVGLDDFAENLRYMCELVRSRGATPVLLTSPIAALEVYYPPGARSGMHRYHERYNKVVRQVAIQQGVDLIDLASVFNRYDNLYDNPQRDPIHYNARGHSVAAERIAAYLRDHDLVPVDRPGAGES